MFPDSKLYFGKHLKTTINKDLTKTDLPGSLPKTLLRQFLILNNNLQIICQVNNLENTNIVYHQAHGNFPSTISIKRTTSH